MTPSFAASFETVADTVSCPPVLRVVDDGVKETAIEFVGAGLTGAGAVDAPPPHPAIHETKMKIDTHCAGDQRKTFIELSLRGGPESAKVYHNSCDEAGAGVAIPAREIHFTNVSARARR